MSSAAIWSAWIELPSYHDHRTMVHMVHAYSHRTLTNPAEGDEDKPVDGFQMVSGDNVCDQENLTDIIKSLV